MSLDPLICGLKLSSMILYEKKKIIITLNPMAQSRRGGWFDQAQILGTYPLLHFIISKDVR